MSLPISLLLLIPFLLVSPHASAESPPDRPLLYVVTNPTNRTSGGARFNAEIGPDAASQTMEAAAAFTWKVFNQTAYPLERKQISIVSLVIDETMPARTPPARTYNNISIHINSNFLGNYTGTNLRRQFAGIVYEEMAGIWQWDGKGHAPRGLVTGIAAYVRLHARYGTAGKVKVGDGERWDQGKGVTARFLAHCSESRKGFVGDLNRKMKDGYNDGFFEELLGKPVELLWSNYRERYARLGLK